MTGNNDDRLTTRKWFYLVLLAVVALYLYVGTYFKF
jgi:hypothetical protein